jgi:hypothetical protein
LPTSRRSSRATTTRIQQEQEDEKSKCYKAIDKHFGVEAAPKAGKKKAAKKATKKKAATKAAPKAKAAAKGGKKKAAKGKAAKKKAAKGKAAKAPDVDADALAQLHLASERIGTISQAIAAMKAAKEAYPELDTQEGAKAAGAALTDIVQGVHKTVKGEQLELPEVDQKVLEGLAKTAPAAQGIPGQESPVQVPGNSAKAATAPAPESPAG